MEKFVINGGVPLRGEITIQGAKNSVLPLLASTLLCRDDTILNNCPNLTDTAVAIDILKCLGAKVEQKGKTIKVNTKNIIGDEIPEFLMDKMRSSIFFLGAIIARQGKAKISLPGGCELGPRPIDLHISALEKMGVTTTETDDYISCEVKGKLQGAMIRLAFPSVGATENIIMAGAVAQGETIIKNAALEPEIVDLANYLNSCGAKIAGAGTKTIAIKGVSKLHGTEHTVISDRIAAATHLSAVASTGGYITIKKINPDYLTEIIPTFEKSGCEIKIYNDSILLKAPSRLRGVGEIITAPYPDFPTDAQAPIMAMLSTANGTSSFVENIFESRFWHVRELKKMGANIAIEGKKAAIVGVGKIRGAQVSAYDLRGGAAMVVAGLSAEGITVVNNLRYIDRGYENMEDTYRSLGGDIKRIITE